MKFFFDDCRQFSGMVFSGALGDAVGWDWTMTSIGFICFAVACVYTLIRIDNYIIDRFDVRICGCVSRCCVCICNRKSRDINESSKLLKEDSKVSHTNDDLPIY